MLYKMKSMNLSGFEKEFILLTVYHGHTFLNNLDEMDLNQKTKTEFRKLVKTFINDLFEVTNFDTS